MTITVSLYSSAANFANLTTLLDGPDTAYLITSSYTFTATDSLAVPLGFRSIDTTTGSAIPPVGFDVAYRNDSAWPALFLPATITFVAVSSTNVAGVLLAAGATSQGICYANLGATLSPTNTTLALSIAGSLLQVSLS